jgi:hypothetical protein
MRRFLSLGKGICQPKVFWWTGWDLNPRLPACKAGDLPLIYRPIVLRKSVLILMHFVLGSCLVRMP